MDINLVLEILLGDQAHDAARFVLHECLGGAAEDEFNALGYAIIVHGVGRVFHFQHVVVERGILRRDIHRNFAQTPLHAAIGHPVERVAAFTCDFVDELRIGRVVVFVHRPIGECFGVERVAWECEALFFLLRIAAQNAAHASRLRIAAPRSHAFYADDRSAQLGRARRGVQSAAARAHDHDIAFVIPCIGNFAGLDSRGIVCGKRRRIVLAICAIGRARVRVFRGGYSNGLAAVGRPVADDARFFSMRRCRHCARRSQAAGQSRRSGQEIAAGNAFVLKSCHGYSPFCTLSMVVPLPTSTGCKSAPA